MLPMNCQRMDRLRPVVMTPSARARVPREEVAAALRRHFRSTWGQSAPPHRPRRRRPVLQGCRLLSVFRARDGTPFWIISESDRALTWVLLPEDF